MVRQWEMIWIVLWLVGIIILLKPNQGVGVCVCVCYGFSYKIIFAIANQHFVHEQHKLSDSSSFLSKQSNSDSLGAGYIWF